MSVISQVVLAFGILAITGCSKLDPNGTLNGSIFIVTKGGESVKLGAVEVRIISEKDFAAYLEAMKPRLASDRSDLERKYRSLLENKAVVLQAADKAQADLNQAKTAYDQANAAFHQAFAQANVAHDKAFAAQHQAADALNQANAADSKTKSEAYFVSQKLAEVETKLSKWNDVTEIYFSELPPAVVSAVTDADGKFSVNISRSGRFVVAATAQRMVGKSTEHYYWLVRVSLDGQKSKTIMLINQNLIETSCPDCIALPSPPSLTVPPRR